MSESGNGQHDARVQVLTAEVRTLMVGSRQVTMSVYKQLDEVQPEEIMPFGRVHSGGAPSFAETGRIEVVGSADGVLARSVAKRQRMYCAGSRIDARPGLSRGKAGRLEVINLMCDNQEWHHSHRWMLFEDEWEPWQRLPLIVLAGLR